jgi:hypothetical protein
VIRTDGLHRLPSIAICFGGLHGNIYEGWSVAQYKQCSILGCLNPLKHEAHQNNTQMLGFFSHATQTASSLWGLLSLCNLE